ncbi:MAG: RNA-binding protein [Candidatus Thorarchaeota archaeon]|jgi:PUA domain protein
MPKIDRIKRRHLLKKRAQKEYMDRIERDLGTRAAGFDPKARLEEGVLDEGTHILLYEGEILFFEEEGRLIPTLHALLDGILTVPTVTVDMGAVRFVANGADIMRPGVTKVDDGIVEGSVVAVVDERHGKPLAVGVSLMSSEDILAATHGKVILSRHHVNDAMWDFGKS